MNKLLDQISTAVILLDLNGRFSYINQSAEQTLNITSRNLIGKRYSYFINAETLPIRQWLFQLSTAETRLFEKKEIAFKNGVTIELELALQKVTYLNQEQLLIEWQSSSIAKRHQQEQELKRYHQVNQQLLQNLAHEIKTPLSGIAGASQLLEMSADQEYLSFSQVISKEVKRLTHLIDRMLLGQKVASKVATNIHEVLEQVIAFLNLGLSKNINFIRDYDPSIPEFDIAPEQIYQVFLNVAQNAIEALQLEKNKNSKNLITFKTRINKNHPIVEYSEQQCIQVSITDNGPGIDEELQPNVFYPMISGKNSTGLGLGIAQSLMQQHHGVIEFTSQKGETQFNCYFPLIIDSKTAK